MLLSRRVLIAVAVKILLEIYILNNIKEERENIEEESNRIGSVYYILISYYFRLTLLPCLLSN